jgi:hypothetical protein
MLTRNMRFVPMIITLVLITGCFSEVLTLKQLRKINKLYSHDDKRAEKYLQRRGYSLIKAKPYGGSQLKSKGNRYIRFWTGSVYYVTPDSTEYKTKHYEAAMKAEGYYRTQLHLNPDTFNIKGKGTYILYEDSLNYRIRYYRYPHSGPF